MEFRSDSTIEPEPFYQKHFEIAKSSFDRLLIKNQPPTLQGLLDREGLKAAELPTYFQGVVDTVCKDDRIYGKIPEIRFLYDTYLATRGVTGNNDTLFDFVQCLSTYENLKDRFLPSARKFEQANIFDKITNFQRKVIHPLDVTLYDDGVDSELSNGIYSFPGEWFLLPQPTKRLAYDVIKKSVAIEALKLKKRGFKSELFHSTGSAALEGIANNQAILSGKLAKDRGINLLTGELNGMINKELDESQTSPRSGHGEVFADAGWVGEGYGYARWFNEFPLTFAIPLKEQREYIEHTYGTDPTRFFWVSEGMLVGPEVPLVNVTHMMVDHPNLDKAKAWANKVAPHLMVTSYDAYKLWRASSDPDRGFERLEDLLKLPTFKVDEKGKVT